jgi:protein SCO1/2
MLQERSRPAGNRFIPDVPVVTHEGNRARFYADLIRDKIVLVGFMSIANDAHYPVTRNLARVQRLLGDRLGREAHLYSITVDAAHDTPGALKAFARQHGAGPGWLFLTGDEAALGAIRGAFFAHRGGHSAHAPRPEAHGPHGGELLDCSIGLLRYGNDAVGLWASVAALADPAQIVERLSWIQARSARPADTPLQRGGPWPTHRPTDPSSRISSRD